MKARKRSRTGAGVGVNSQHGIHLALRLDGFGSTHLESEAGPFGPQSTFSALLGHREFLEKEIRRGTQLLELRHRGPCKSPNDQLKLLTAKSHPWKTGPGIPVLLPDQVMEQFLTGWVARLKRTLELVTKRIESQTAQEVTVHADESMFELLRSAH